MKRSPIIKFQILMIHLFQFRIKFRYVKLVKSNAFQNYPLSPHCYTFS